MILVTGATGMLGAHLLYDLLQKQYRVRAIKRPNSDMSQILSVFGFYSQNSNELFARIEWTNADISDYESIYEAMENVEYVYHCAAMVSFNSRDRKKMIENNVEGTANVVNAALARDVKKLCHVSSIAALGNGLPNEEINEETQRNPSFRYSGYAISKYKSELEVWRGAEEGLKVIIVNPSVIIGPGTWTKGSPSIFYNVWKGLPFYTKGITGFVDVKDVSRTMIELMNSNITNQRFVINSENLSYKDLLSRISEQLQKAAPRWFANNFLLQLAWRADWLKSKLTAGEHVITKEIAQTANSTSLYSNKKISQTIPIRFIPVTESINYNCTIFLKNFVKQNKNQ